MDKVSKLGFSKHSPFKHKNKLRIKSGSIDMSQTEFPLLGVSEQTGETKLMLPGQNFIFDNTKSVMEYKLKQGGYINLLQNYLPTIPENQQDELLDTLDALPEQERYDALEEYMNGGCYKCGGKMKEDGYYQDGGYYPEPYKPFMSLQDNFYYDPYKGQVVERDSKTGTYTKSNKDIKVDKNKTKAFLKQIESELISPETTFGGDYSYATPEQIQQIESIFHIKTTPNKAIVAKSGSNPKSYDYATLMKKAKVDHLFYIDKDTGVPYMQYGAKDIGVEEPSDTDYMEEIVAGTSKQDVYTKSQSQDIKNVRVNVGIPKEMFDFGPTPYGRYTPGEKQINIRKDVNEGKEPGVHRQDVLAHEVKHYDNFNWGIPNQVSKEDLEYLNSNSHVPLAGDLPGEELPAYNAQLRSYLVRNNPQYNNVADPITMNESMWLFNQKDETIDYMKKVYKTPENMVKFVNKYHKGGKTPTYPEMKQGNVEVENQESAKLPSGELVKFEGATHENGGIKTQLPGGTIIFSDHIKSPQNITELVLGRKTNKKYSYADLSKKFPTQKSLSTLKNPDSDPFEINTAELTLNKNQAMLDTIFSAQEAEKIQKSKTKFQDGGMTWKSNPNLLPGQIMTPDFSLSPFDNDSFPYVNQRQDYEQGKSNLPVVDYYTYLKQLPNRTNPDLGYEDVGKSYPFDSGKGSVAKYLFDQRGDYMLPEVTITPQAAPSVQAKRPIGKSRAVKASTAASNPTEDNFLASVPLPLSTLPQRDLSSQLIHSRNPFEENQDVVLPTDSDSESYPGFAKSRGKSKFGINPKLAGTIMDIGLAMSDNLNVEAPVLFNNKTYPLFNRFVNFDNKEPGRNLALSVQQIQNSNMPEQVKQAQIAQLTAQANEQQSQVDFGNQQRYEQKQERDINKLQQYQDRNTLVGNQDLENYLQRKGRVESLKNEFKARRKSNIVNSIRGYADYADELHLKNQIYADNYRINPITGIVDFTGSKQDPLKQQEQLMAQYQQNAQNQITLSPGVTMTMISPGVGIVVDANGKAEVVKI